MSKLMQSLWDFIQTKWQFIVLISAFIVGLTAWIVNIYNIRKTRLEIQKLRKELAEKGTTKIPVATLEEISEFASKHPSPEKLRKYLNLKFSELPESSEPVKLSPTESKQFAEALMKIEETTLERTFIGELGFTIGMAAILYLLEVIVSSLRTQEWGVSIISIFTLAIMVVIIYKATRWL